MLTNYNKSSWLNIMSEVVYGYWKKIKTIYRLHKLVFDRVLHVSTDPVAAGSSQISYEGKTIIVFVASYKEGY